MFCKNCGKEAKDEANFCLSCGASLKDVQVHNNSSLSSSSNHHSQYPRKTKLSQKTWFMWFMLIIFFPVGLFLLWKHSTYSMKTKGIITGVFVILCVISSFNSDRSKTTSTNKPNNVAVEQQAPKEAAPIEKQREKFTAWQQRTMQDLSNTDENWKIWAQTFNGMGNGSVSTYQAYDNLKILSARLDIARSNIKKNTVPSELTDEHKKQLNSSLEQLSTWIYYRQKACDDMKDLIDENNFKPSELDKIKNTVQSGDSQMMSALVKITSVQNDLGLLEKK